MDKLWPFSSSLWGHCAVFWSHHFSKSPWKHVWPLPSSPGPPPVFVAPAAAGGGWAVNSFLSCPILGPPPPFPGLAPGTVVERAEAPLQPHNRVHVRKSPWPHSGTSQPEHVLVLGSPEEASAAQDMGTARVVKLRWVTRNLVKSKLHPF